MALLEEDFETTIKVIVVGNGGIGKTSLIQKFAKGIFTDTYKKTIGVDFLEKKLYVPALQSDATIFLWDTAGQEEFDAVTRSYYRGAGACVIAFSTTDRASFDDVPKWKRKVEAECGKLPMVLIQNKIDLIDQAVMTKEEAEKMASDVGLRFYRTCVKENVNVNEVFMYLVEQYLSQTKEMALAQPVASIGFTKQASEATIGTVPQSPAPAATTAPGAVPATPAAATTGSAAGGQTAAAATATAAAPATPGPQAPVAVPSTPAAQPVVARPVGRTKETIDLTDTGKPAGKKSRKKFSCVLL